MSIHFKISLVRNELVTRLKTHKHSMQDLCSEKQKKQSFFSSVFIQLAQSGKYWKKNILLYLLCRHEQTFIKFSPSCHCCPSSEL